MTDLSQFGGGIDQPETSETDDSTDTKSRYTFRAGRCWSLAAGGRRCRQSASEGDLCYMHSREYRTITVESDPVTLIRRTGKTSAARCRAIQGNGDRCTNGCGPLDLRCGLHQGTDAGLVDRDDLADDELDVELIRQAVHNVYGLEEEPLTVYEDGLWLPWQYCEASHLIVRAPTKTGESRLRGDVPRRRISPLARASDWDPDYLEGEGRTTVIQNEECLPGENEIPMVGLKIAGEDQRWFPVEIKGGEPW